ncbi:MAG: 3-phosphoshikimate 1-carboxyvinyltransferase [Bacteroidota bacterium]
MIIQGLSREKIELHNLSSARDTQTMIRLLESEGHVLDVIDAGTTMRFLTAFFAATGRDQILTGTPRMCKRPIGILVEALRSLGANIQYWKQEGYPPLHLQSSGQPLNGTELDMQGNVSSQFISAILMIAPTLPEGLKLNLIGDISSRPYIDLTRSIMAHFGVKTHWEGQSIIVAAQAYQAGAYTIESDWSAASYWYSVAALSNQANIHLQGLRATSWQGDHQVAQIMRHFGVASTFDSTGVRLTRTDWQPSEEVLEIDFVETPDLAQTIAVVSAGLGQPVKMTGLHTLRVKETDRIAAIKEELAKFAVEVEVEGDEAMIIRGKVNDAKPTIHTYEDHRMAMAFAPLVLTQGKLDLDEPEVVKKSYPEFWEHLALAGVQAQEW